MSKPILTYFNFAGRAESIRMLLRHAGVDFEDKMISIPDYASDPEIKKGLEFKALPEWDDGKKFYQSSCILRRLGIQHGYYSQDLEEQYLIDSAVEGA